MSAALTWCDPLDVFAGRTNDFTASIYKADGEPCAISATDVVRFKLSRRHGGAPLLDVDSVAATANGSLLTVTALGVDDVSPATVLLRLAQGDTQGLAPGVYLGEFALVDDSETNPANAIKTFGRGQVHVHASASGDVGLT